MLPGRSRRRDGEPASICSTALAGRRRGLSRRLHSSALGGVIQGRLHPRDDQERDAAIAAGYDLGRVLTTDDLVKGEDVFFAATGVTDGVLVQGVRFSADYATTESIVMRARSGTIRVIHGEHRGTKLKQIYGGEI